MDTTRPGILVDDKGLTFSSQVVRQSTVSFDTHLPAQILTTCVLVIKSGGSKISAIDIEREVIALDYISEVSVMAG